MRELGRGGGLTDLSSHCRRSHQLGFIFRTVAKCQSPQCLLDAAVLGTERTVKLKMKSVKNLEAMKKIVGKCCDGLRVGEVPKCGRGIFATKTFFRDDFICVYTGEIITKAEYFKRYGSVDSQRSYTFHFYHEEKRLVVDATHEDGSLARLANHSWKLYNAYMQKVVVNGEPHIVLFAAQDIFPGQEIRYNYGDEIVKESGKIFGWLSEIKPYN